MALRTIEAYAAYVDDDLSDIPLLSREAMRPCWEHEARRLLAQVE